MKRQLSAVERIRQWGCGGVRYLAEHAALLTAIVLFTVASYFVWTKTRHSDIGSNLFAGGIQLLFTFFIFERLIAARDEARERPRRLVAHHDVSIWLNNIFHLYGEILGEKIPISELFTREAFVKMGRKLDLNSRAPVLPDRDWWQWMSERSEQFHDMGKQVMQRDGASLPPDVYRAIHAFSNGPFLGVQRKLPVMKKVSGESPRGDWFFWQGEGPSPEELAAVLLVHRWALEYYWENVKQEPKLVKVWDSTNYR